MHLYQPAQSFPLVLQQSSRAVTVELLNTSNKNTFGDIPMETCDICYSVGIIMIMMMMLNPLKASLETWVKHPICYDKYTCLSSGSEIMPTQMIRQRLVISALLFPPRGKWNKSWSFIRQSVGNAAWWQVILLRNARSIYHYGCTLTPTFWMLWQAASFFPTQDDYLNGKKETLRTIKNKNTHTKQGSGSVSACSSVFVVTRLVQTSCTSQRLERC